MGALWSHQMSALALPGWVEEGRAEFGVLAWGTAAVEGFLHPSKPWLMFFLHLAQDVSAGQGTAAGAIPPLMAWPGHGAPSPSLWGAQPGVLLGPGHGPPAGRDPPGLLPTDGDALRAAGLSQLHSFRFFFFGDTTRLSDTPGPMGIIWREIQEPGRGSKGENQPHPHISWHCRLCRWPSSPSLWCAGDGEQLSQGWHPSGGDEMLHAGKKKIQKGIQREKKLAVKELKLSTSHMWKGRGGKTLKRVLTSLEASGTLGDQKNNTSKTSRLPEDR